MNSKYFIDKLRTIGIDTYIGIPDSTLKEFCNYLNNNKEKIKNYIPANEGAAVSLAAGTYLATGKPACVYMQNSGIGNAENPIISLIHKEVYSIPMLFLVGWRGEPGIKDEPQHKYQGKITCALFDILDIKYAVMDKTTTPSELCNILNEVSATLKENRQFAIIVRKECFDATYSEIRTNSNVIVRESAIRSIIKTIHQDDVIVSTTGKISRELYESSKLILNNCSQSFFTVGSMGHASMIALGIALNKTNKRIYCIDGDGAVLMHMGALPFIAKQNPNNFVHILLNNDAHESVGGMPTGAVGADYSKIAKAAGYMHCYQCSTMEELECHLEMIKSKPELTFLEVKVSLYSRNDLGRPQESPVVNKLNFMNYHGDR